MSLDFAKKKALAQKSLEQKVLVEIRFSTSFYARISLLFLRILAFFAFALLFASSVLICVPYALKTN